jgi:nicotinamide riboside transporter PnuC
MKPAKGELPQDKESLASQSLKQKNWYYITAATVIVVTVVTYIVFRHYRQAPIAEAPEPHDGMDGGARRP